MKYYTVIQGLAPDTLPAFHTAGAEEMRLLALLLAAPDTHHTADSLAERLGLSTESVLCALAYWRGAGALLLAETVDEPVAPTAPKKPLRSADKLPSYSPSERARMIETENLAAFISTCQDTYGKVFSDVDVGIVLGLHEHLALSPDYICLLIAFCTEHAPKPMRYIEKVAFSLHEQGVSTVEDLTAYIEKKRRNDSREGHLRKLFGIGDRALTSKEEAAFLRWCEEYGYDDAVIGMAYDITVNATGKAAVAYADKLISKWNTAGCKNAEDVKALLEHERTARPAAKASKKPKTAAEAEKDAMRSFDVDDFFARALDRSYGEQK